MRDNEGLEKARTEPIGTVSGKSVARHRSELGASFHVYVKPGTPLFTLSPDAQAIIDGLRAELERWKGSGTHGQIAEWRDAAAERDKLRVELERLRAELAAFQSAVDHVTADGKTTRSFTSSGGWAIVHCGRLADIECAEEALSAAQKDAARWVFYRDRMRSFMANPPTDAEVDANVDALRAKDVQP